MMPHACGSTARFHSDVRWISGIRWLSQLIDRQKLLGAGVHIGPCDVYWHSSSSVPSWQDAYATSSNDLASTARCMKRKMVSIACSVLVCWLLLLQ